MDGSFMCISGLFLPVFDLERCHGLGFGKEGPGSMWLPVVAANNTLSYSQGEGTISWTMRSGRRYIQCEPPVFRGTFERVFKEPVIKRKHTTLKSRIWALQSTGRQARLVGAEEKFGCLVPGAEERIGIPRILTEVKYHFPLLPRTFLGRKVRS